MGAEYKEDCVFSADNARARREAFERDVLPSLEMKMAADRDGLIDQGTIDCCEQTGRI